MRGIIITILMVMLFGIVSAQGLAEQTLIDALPPWLPLLTIAILIGYSIVAIMFMISKVFRIHELNAWAKTSLADVTGSIFLVAIILIVLGFADGVFIAAIGDSPYAASTRFMTGTSEKLLDIYIDGIWLSTAIGQLAGAPLQYSGGHSTDQGVGTIPLSWASENTYLSASGQQIPILIFELDLFRVGYSKFRGGSVFLTSLGSIQSLTLTATFITLISSMILDFIQATAIPVMVPFGMLLSSFSITRKLGRTLLAFGVGLHLFVPVSLLMTEQMFNSAYRGSATNPPEIPEPGSVSSFTSRVLAHNVGNVLLKTLIGPLAADAGGSLPFQLLCIPICGVIAAPCLIFYAACFAGCFYPCFGVIMPMEVYPVSKVAGEIIYRVLEVANNFQLMAAIGSDAAGFGLSFLQSGLNALPAIQAAASFPNAPFSGVAGLLGQFFIDSAFNAKLAAITLDYIPYIMQYSIPVVLMPIIVLIVVVTAIRSLSPAIGGEVQILGVSELI